MIPSKYKEMNLGEILRRMPEKDSISCWILQSIFYYQVYEIATCLSLSTSDVAQGVIDVQSDIEGNQEQINKRIERCFP